MSEGSASRSPTLHVIPWHSPYKWEEKTRKKNSQGRSKSASCSRLFMSICSSFDRQPRQVCRSRSVLKRFGKPGSTIGQLMYLSSCRTRRFPTPANFESKLSVRLLVWSVKNGSPKSSWICLLPVYLGAMIAKRRHWDWITYFSLHGCERRTSRWGTRSP